MVIRNLLKQKKQKKKYSYGSYLCAQRLLCTSVNEESCITHIHVNFLAFNPKSTLEIQTLVKYEPSLL